MIVCARELNNNKQENKHKGTGTEHKTNPNKNDSKVWNDLEKVKGKDRRTSGTGSKKKFYEWDYTHNDIEVYDKRGNHLGSMDPVTGEMYKPAVPGRTITP
ncbi:MAG: colicin E3/pyocin S6 family cytotoxin [Erysipelothrix sp.]